MSPVARYIHLALQPDVVRDEHVITALTGQLLAGWQPIAVHCSSAVEARDEAHRLLRRVGSPA